MYLAMGTHCTEISSVMIISIIWTLYEPLLKGLPALWFQAIAVNDNTDWSFGPPNIKVGEKNEIRCKIKAYLLQKYPEMKAPEVLSC